MIETTLKVNGMMCGMCEAHVNEAIRNNFKVKSVAASHTKNEVVITSEEALDEEKVKKVIGDTGYEYQGMTTAEAKKKGLFHFGK